MTASTQVTCASHMRINFVLMFFEEQYAYMCDLKRTLDATVCKCSPELTRNLNQCLLGSLRAGNAIWNGKNGVAVVSHCFISTSQCQYSIQQVQSDDRGVVSSYEAQAHILLENSARDREGTDGTEEVDEISRRGCRDRGGKNQGTQLYGPWSDKSKKLVYQS
jgi:hypothetical protein